MTHHHPLPEMPIIGSPLSLSRVSRALVVTPRRARRPSNDADDDDDEPFRPHATMRRERDETNDGARERARVRPRDAIAIAIDTAMHECMDRAVVARRERVDAR